MWASMKSRPRRRFRREDLRYVGPGIVWAMSAIGQTHVVLSTYAGARFGFGLLWMVVLAHVLAYPVFEYGARYAIATGHTLNHAYLQTRGGRWIMAPLFVVVVIAIPFLLLAALGSVTASILLAAFPSPGFAAWATLVAVGTALLLFGGHYGWLERLNLAMASILLVGVAVAFSLQPPGVDALAAGLVPAVPAGSLITLVALMRLPSDAGSSVILSTWALHRREASPRGRAGGGDAGDPARAALWLCALARGLDRLPVARRHGAAAPRCRSRGDRPRAPAVPGLHRDRRRLDLSALHRDRVRGTLQRLLRGGRRRAAPVRRPAASDPRTRPPLRRRLAARRLHAADPGRRSRDRRGASSARPSWCCSPSRLVSSASP